MSLSEQIFCSHMLRQLREDPLGHLQQYQLTVGLPAGYQSEVKNLCFSAVDSQTNGRHMRFGTKSFCRTIPGMVNDPADVKVIATPMRTWNDPNRQDALQRFNAGGTGPPHFWVTVRQTGCSVLILDWGGGACSMVHISPYDKSQFNRFSSRMFPANTDRGAGLRGSYLRKELTTIANMSRNQDSPFRYILVQSSYTINQGTYLQLLGVSKKGNWNFYLQTKQGATLTARALDWESWNWYTSYRPVTW